MYLHLFAWNFNLERGCKPLSAPENGLIAVQNNGASVLVFCKPKFEIAGSAIAFCDGESWDRGIGRCRATSIEPETYCDFETSDNCGWVNSLANDFIWTRRNGWISYEKLESGPRHDHTVSVLQTIICDLGTIEMFVHEFCA